MIILPVLFIIGMPSETSVAIVSVLLGGVLERFPKLKFCFAHGGKLCSFLNEMPFLNVCPLRLYGYSYIQTYKQYCPPPIFKLIDPSP